MTEVYLPAHRRNIAESVIIVLAIGLIAVAASLYTDNREYITNGIVGTITLSVVLMIMHLVNSKKVTISDDTIEIERVFPRTKSTISSKDISVIEMRTRFGSGVMLIVKDNRKYRISVNYISNYDALRERLIGLASETKE